ncbi:hypothetical protein P4U99_22975 [Brevibacillus agri]|uniref:hypothetical protein n=1 Tax=Brevibacillus TaxID=55080 RepID=UPI001561F655|nr:MULTISPECIES: hypothetical protein [Brevibacillus]MBE5394524.1 hypothetical protein [Brevibacillus borstelensis]MED1646015.1 hypothetical protein [Brevibacillus agri]MED1656328.1 hypothetical protein [Brevibacillus agri]MED1689250.1 hypothetical protein [Brevibacillus agri]MED1693773.1 hypothetical protein [Brevibacillus agri]
MAEKNASNQTHFIPRRFGQPIPAEIFESLPSCFEHTGEDLFWSDEQMQNAILVLVAHFGLQRFVQALSPHSREELMCILEEGQLK